MELQKKDFLGIKGAINDLKSLPTWFKIALIIGAFFVVFFNFFSIDVHHSTQLAPQFSNLSNYYHSYFAPFQQYAKVFSQGSAINGFVPGSRKIAIIATIFYSLNGVAAFSGILSVGLIIFGKKSQFLWGMINGFFYCLFALVMGLTGDFVMNIIFVIMGPFGWWWFSFKVKKQRTIRIYKLHKRMIIVLLTLVMVGVSILLWYFFIPWFHELIFGKNSYQAKEIIHIFDSSANGINLIGYGLQILNFSEQFWFWVIIDIIKIFVYTPLVQGEFTITILLQFTVWIFFVTFALYQQEIVPIKLQFLQWRTTKQSQNRTLTPNQ